MKNATLEFIYSMLVKNFGHILSAEMIDQIKDSIWLDILDNGYVPYQKYDKFDLWDIIKLHIENSL